MNINIKQLLRTIWFQFKRRYPTRIIGLYPNNGITPIGHALVSYISEPIMWKSDDKRFNGHSNLWESAEITKILNELGYIVDCISFTDNHFKSNNNYDIVFDIFKNFPKYSSSNTHTILHLTGSDPLFAKNAELNRINNLKSRKGFYLIPRRLINENDINKFSSLMNTADTLTLVGNEVTLSTYPKLLQKKIKCIPVTGSVLSEVRELNESLQKNEFIWFGGAGAVHKGLDLVLEVFAKNPNLKLHIIGPYEHEKDFMKLFDFEITHCPNIMSHGFLYPSEKKFKEITKNVTAFVFPSCSEGISTGAITCMQYGFLPIISKNTGISITKDMGVLLHDCSITEIESAIKYIAEKPIIEIKEMISKSQTYALNTFSRAEFHKSMKDILKVISQNTKNNIHKN